jgi:hypothetical protein
VNTTSNKGRLSAGISVITIAAALGFASPAIAQTTSTIRGHVEGSAAGSTVTVTDLNTGRSETAKLDASGNYNLVGVPPSTYRIQSGGKPSRLTLRPHLRPLPLPLTAEKSSSSDLERRTSKRHR